MTRRVLGLLLTLGALAASLATVACSSPLPPHVSIPGVTLRLDQDHAPLQAPGHDGVAGLARVHEPVSFGPLVLTNTTSHPITIVKVSPGPRDAGLAYLGVRASASQTRRVFSLGVAQGAFPYPSGGADWEAVEGVVVRPEHDGGARGVEILVGLAAIRPGRLTMRSVSVTYQLGAQRYVTTYGDTYTVCAPPTIPHCDAVPAS